MKMTESEFDRCMAVLITGVGRSMSPEQVDVWREFFSDMSFDELKRGIVMCLREYKFAGFPPVGLIRQAAGVSGGVVDGDAAAVLAWDQVLKAIRREGAYKSIDWGDPAIPAAIEAVAGSWAQLCDTLSDQLLTWTRKAFCEAYRAMRGRVKSGTVSAGLIANDAGRIGFEAPPPVRLGREPTGTYGFGNGAVPALPAPTGDIQRLTEELVKRLPDIEPVEDSPPDLTIDEQAERIEAMRHAMKVRFGEKPFLKARATVKPTAIADNAGTSNSIAATKSAARKATCR